MKLKKIRELTGLSIISIIMGTLLGSLGLLLCSPFVYTLFTGTGEYGASAKATDYVLYGLFVIPAILLFRYSFYSFQYVYKLLTDSKYSKDDN